MAYTINLNNYTHFIKTGPGEYELFAYETCDHCGKPCLHGDRHTPRLSGGLGLFSAIVQAGLKRVQELPDELGWSDTLGEAVCMDCYNKAEQEAEAEQATA